MAASTNKKIYSYKKKTIAKKKEMFGKQRKHKIGKTISPIKLLVFCN